MIKQAMLSGLNATINQALHLNPHTLTQLAELNGNVVAIHINGLCLRFYLQLHNDGVRLLADYDGSVQTTICGAPFTLLNLARASFQKKPRRATSHVTIEGDTDLGCKLQRIFQELAIDWEEQLAGLIGDVPAYHMARAARGVSRRLRQTKTSAGQTITQYVQEEMALQPTRTALNVFYQDIVELRDAVTRLEARIQLYRTYTDSRRE